VGNHRILLENNLQMVGFLIQVGFGEGYIDCLYHNCCLIDSFGKYYRFFNIVFLVDDDPLSTLLKDAWSINHFWFTGYSSKCFPTVFDSVNSWTIAFVSGHSLVSEVPMMFLNDAQCANKSIHKVSELKWFGWSTICFKQPLTASNCRWLLVSLFGWLHPRRLHSQKKKTAILMSLCHVSSNYYIPITLCHVHIVFLL
jgi:hypothetical protein